MPPFEGSEYQVANTIGHAAGALTFGHFLLLALWDRPLIRLRTNPVAMLAAGLAFVWNFASFAVLMSGESEDQAGRITTAIAFCSLSLLPAVLLDLCLVNRLRPIVHCGYGISILAIGFHLMELVGGAAFYHRAGLGLITVGFGLLTVISVFGVLSSSPHNPRLLGSRIIAVMLLFLFAVSFVHFSDGQNHRAWSTELMFHHAGIPLALFILLQDYRFVLLDAFIRFLANGLLAGIFAVAITAGLARLSFPIQLLAVTLLLVAFAAIRGSTQRLLSRILFRRKDPDGIIEELRVVAKSAPDEDAFFEGAIRHLAEFMETTAISTGQFAIPAGWHAVMPTLITDIPDHRELQRLGAEVLVPIRLANGGVRPILLGGRRGGRRYLSEDLTVLTRLAASIAEHADQLRDAELRRLVSQAELRALQAQIHPHFLFNALNTLYGTIPREAAGARRLLVNLADVFRYFLQAERTFIPLEDELRIVRAYSSIEELRLGGKLRFSIEVEDGVNRELIPVLSIQPLVENAIKHGVAGKPDGGSVRVEVKREEAGVCVRVHDTGTGFGESKSAEGLAEHAGVGLANVSRRLRLCYGPSADLAIESSASGTTVSFVTG